MAVAYIDSKIFSSDVCADLSSTPPNCRRYSPLFDVGTPCFLIGSGESTTVLFHGNAQTITMACTLSLATRISQAGKTVVAVVEYPGFWDDGQRKTAKGLYSASAIAVETLSAEFGPVHVVGYSVGTAAAARVCANQPDNVRSLTLVAPMVSALRLAEDHIPGFRLFSAFSKPYDTLCVRADASRTKGKDVLIVHGGTDKLIDPAHGKEITAEYTKQENAATYYEVDMADHMGVIATKECIGFIGAHIMSL